MAFGSVTKAAPLTLDGNFEFVKTSGGDAVAIQLAFGETVSLNFNVDAAGTTDDVEVEIIQGHRVATGFGLDGAASGTSLDLNTTSDPIANDDDLNSTFLVMTSGGEKGEGRTITDSVASTDTVTLDHALSGTPSASETYDRYAANPIKLGIDMSAAVAENNMHSLRFATSWTAGEWVLVRIRASGATDAHRVNLSYQKDGGPA